MYHWLKASGPIWACVSVSFDTITSKEASGREPEIVVIRWVLCNALLDILVKKNRAIAAVELWSFIHCYLTEKHDGICITLHKPERRYF